MPSAMGAARRDTTTHDVVMRGGRIIDPESGLDAIGNLALDGGIIAAISGDRMAGTGELDARMDELLVRCGGRAMKHTGDGRLFPFHRLATTSSGSR